MKDIMRILFFMLLVKPFLMVVLGVNIFGKEYLPRNRQFIMVANHNSHLDTLALLSLFPIGQLKNIHPVAAADYFCKSALLSWFSTVFLNIIPISRENISKANNPLKKMCDALEAGDSLIIFPEGSRGKPEEMAPFQSGVAHLVHKFPEVPVVPVYLRGMGRALPKGEFILVPFFCDIHIGKPVFCQGRKEEIVKTLESILHELERTGYD
jgi:1-acyl-sn-glycerol-3-phosphate acyltransferase